MQKDEHVVETKFRLKELNISKNISPKFSIIKQAVERFSTYRHTSEDKKIMKETLFQMTRNMKHIISVYQ